MLSKCTSFQEILLIDLSGAPKLCDDIQRPSPNVEAKIQSLQEENDYQC